jgi:hypothetical protein
MLQTPPVKVGLRPQIDRAGKHFVQFSLGF